ncbi:MAG: response regulator transcription factor [Planctomycetes bacterium]|nr:response regulator transcription factor [Planctomycetota bacterium]
MAEPEHLLLVEDEEGLILGLEYALKREGYRVTVARDGEAGLSAARADRPDLLVLDLMLPKRSGFEVLEILRGEGHAYPVILLTALGQEIDKVRGLDLGADDYVVKPFGLSELLARIRARLRRQADAPAPSPSETLSGFSLGDLRIDLNALRVVNAAGEPEELSVREADMLRLLYRERGKPVGRTQFLDEVWGLDRFPTTRTVDQHIAKLRKKIELDPKRPRHLVTVHGRGYRLEV